jgi:cytosine/adenosine deaminase-related metal-dependent hydrolase
MDPAVGDFERADVLVEGDTIAAIGPDLATTSGDGTVVIDASATIVIPGLVDTHRHMWQGQLRRPIPNVDIPVYLGLRNASRSSTAPRTSTRARSSLPRGPSTPG